MLRTILLAIVLGIASAIAAMYVAGQFVNPFPFEIHDSHSLTIAERYREDDQAWEATRRIEADLQARVETLSYQVAILNHACSPVDTGGGVTQCNPARGFEQPVARLTRAQGDPPHVHAIEQMVRVTCAFRSFEDGSVRIEDEDAARFLCMKRLRPLLLADHREVTAVRVCVREIEHGHAYTSDLFTQCVDDYLNK